MNNAMRAVRPSYALVALALAATFATHNAHADTPAPASSSSATPANANPDANDSRRGVAVVAVGNVSGAAWSLAQAVYADSALRPPSLVEPVARVLAGEPPAPDAPTQLRDTAAVRSAIHGDDAPSRGLLASIASQLHVRALVVVAHADASTFSARVFAADTASFDPARYAPDDSSDAAHITWVGAEKLIARIYGVSSSPTSLAPAAATAPNSAPALAPLAPLPPVDASNKPVSKSRAFYESPWFWGAVGAAAFGATAVYFATRDNDSGSIHLQLQVPK